MNRIVDKIRELEHELNPPKINKYGRTDTQETALNALILKYIVPKGRKKRAKTETFIY